MVRSLINPFDKAKSSFAIASRHYALRDISEEALCTLLQFLRIPYEEHVDFRYPPQSWIKDQELAICKLDYRVRMPRDIISRAAIAAGKHSIKWFPEAAVLCQAHKGLDPRVVRNLMLLVGNEATLRTEKYRKPSRDQHGMLLQLPKAAEEWIDGMDAIASLWLGGREGFVNIYGYPPKIDLGFPYIGCEACRLAIVGGSPSMLADLRTSIMIRQQGYERQRRRKNPRFAYILRNWYRQYKHVKTEDVDTDKDRRHYVRYIRKKSEAALPALKHARAMIVEERHRVMCEKREYGKHSKRPARSSSHRSHRLEGKRPSSSRSSHRSRPRTSDAHYPRCEKADTRASSPPRPQSAKDETSRPDYCSIRASKATLATRITEWPSLMSDSDDRNCNEERYLLSPMTDKWREHDKRCHDRPPTPLSPDQEPRKYAFVDDEAAEDEFFEEDEDEDDAEAANAWFKHRTSAMSVAARVKLARALPAFSAFAVPDEDADRPDTAQALPAFDAMSAVPPPLSAPTNESAANDRDSWVSATVVTWKPSAVPPEETYVSPRPSSSIYTASPVKQRSTYRPCNGASDDLAWRQWKKRFVDDETLAALEGRVKDS